jgi:hypothetical protein
MARLRKEWITGGQFAIGDATDLTFLRKFALSAEHTWGTDTKTYLDHDHYKPADLEFMLEKSGYQKMMTSWAEKRRNIDDAVAGLPAPLKAQAVGRLAKLKPVVPGTEGLNVFKAAKDFETAHFTVGIDEKTGAIRRLLAKGREWATPEHPLALFSYQTLSADDYAKFMASYVTSKADWAPQDFGKPNIDHFGARSKTWTPTLVNCWAGENEDGRRLLARMKIDDAAAEKSGVVAWPQKLYLELLFPKNEPVMKIQFYCFGKVANRMPEAMWLTFRPDAPDAKGWMIEKSDYSIDPLNVVRGGNRHIHALSKGITYKDGFSIDTLDAPVIALGEKSSIYFSKEQPDISTGVHFSLFNNAWGTNYIQWFGEDLRFRFEVRT